MQFFVLIDFNLIFFFIMSYPSTLKIIFQLSSHILSTHLQLPCNDSPSSRTLEGNALDSGSKLWTFMFGQLKFSLLIRMGKILFLQKWKYKNLLYYIVRRLEVIAMIISFMCYFYLTLLIEPELCDY